MADNEYVSLRITKWVFVVFLMCSLAANDALCKILINVNQVNSSNGLKETNGDVGITQEYSRKNDIPR